MGCGTRSLRAILAAASALGLAVQCPGQARDPAREDVGSVSGHIYCADTNAPARMASVMLEPVREPAKEPDKSGSQGAEHGAGISAVQDAPTMTVVQTSLDGSFTIPKVKPGSYYVVVEKQGYVSPIAEFPVDEIEKPTPEQAERMAKALHKITVEAHQTAQVEERIERGAAIAGSVSFDDGSPASGIRVYLWRKKKDGNWSFAIASSTSFSPGYVTDDQGRYRLPGLSAGEYIVEIKMAISETKVARASGGFSSTWSGNPQFSLSFYSGGATRKKDAASFKLIAGEERPGEDIVIPLTKMHRVTGTLIAMHDGHVINAASVLLLYPDDKSQLASAEVGQDQPTFDFQFVPEGDYILKVINARDATWAEAPRPERSFGYIPSVEKASKFYDEEEQPFNVRGDTTGLVVSVPEKGATSTAGVAAQAGSPE